MRLAERRGMDAAHDDWPDVDADPVEALLARYEGAELTRYLGAEMYGHALRGALGAFERGYTRAVKDLKDIEAERIAETNEGEG